jgi:1,2-diacylglycerol 3-alpha-glucosyltransferase
VPSLDLLLEKPGTSSFAPARCKTELAVLWIDWYAYHLSRFAALCDHPALVGRVAGIEMVGGTGVHRGLKFREAIPEEFPVRTILPDGEWRRTSKWLLARLIWKHLEQLNPSTVLVPGYYNVPALASALWGRWKGRRTVLMTESTEMDHGRSVWKERLKALLIRSVFDWAIAGGKPHRRYLEKLGFPPDRIASFYDVVDNAGFRTRAEEIRSRFSSADYSLPENFFLYVGRLAEEKNVRGLVESFVEYRKAGGKHSLVIVGEGPLGVALRSQAQQSGLAESIHFAGLKTSVELAPYHAFASCFVLPSTREPWGLVVNEAMAAGLPLIVSNRCGCAEDLLQPGKNGFSFDPSQPGELLAALQAVDRSSAGQLAAMGRRSSEIISRYSVEAWACEVARLTGLKEVSWQA